MHTDKNTGTPISPEAVDATEESQDGELSWLLDIDLSEPEERLFAIDQSGMVDTGLTDYELEVARRPMVRGSAGADDLETYIEEEIVISSETHSSDIYASNVPAPSARSPRESHLSDDPMSIDYSRTTATTAAWPAAAISEGLDILGLEDDDDMGEKYLVIKRVKSSGHRASVTPTGGESQEPVDAGESTAAANVRPAAGETPALRLVSAKANAPATAVVQMPAVEAETVKGMPAQAGVTGDPLATVTPMLPLLMDELVLVVNERLMSLGLAPGSVRAEVQLAVDSGAADLLLADGYGPVIAVCPMPLACLQQLRQAEVDAIYLSLVHGQDGLSCNQLFDEDFEPAAVQGQAWGNATADDLALPLDLESEADFSADGFVMDAPDGTTGGQWPSLDDDIEDMFADFGSLENTTAAELFQPAPDAPAEDAQAGDFDGFAEGIFGDEMSPAAEAADSEFEGDLDALFDSLGLQSDDAGELCDPNAEEAVAGAGHLQLVAQAQDSAQMDVEDSTAESAEAEAAACQQAPLTLIPAGVLFSQASPGGGEIFADFLDAFIEEGSAELEKLEDAVAVWEKAVASEEAFVVVSRILHTIKGIAKGVGLQFYGTLIHNFETLLGALPRPQPGAEGDYFRVVNAWLDACVRGLDHIQDARADISHELPRSAGQTARQAEDGDNTAESSGRVQAPLAPPVAAPVARVIDAQARQVSKRDADEGARALAAQQSVRITSEKLDHLLNLSNEAQQLSVRTAQSVTRSKRASGEMQSRLASVRSHIAAIADRALRSVAAKGVRADTPMDALEMDQYSELQEAANILREGVEDLADLVDFATRQNGQIEALLKQQTKVISSIGTSIRGARVVPVSRLIPGLRRLVRTVSVDLGKTVSFQVLNELGTLDRDDYARCQTILDHMVRNALDHGIEGQEERLAAGKPADGMVTIDIRKAGADAVITLTDDGRGIDPDTLRASAIRKGLDVDVSALTDAEALRLIFNKGFSTASSVSQISGRGVGMDIVMSEVQGMGGDIRIDSLPGRGTSFHIRVPSSVTVNGALLVSAGEQSYAIPLGGLIAVEQVPVEEFFAAVHNNTRLSLAGMECEPAYLATLCRTGHSLEAKTWKHNVPVIIAGSPERYMAIAIDDVEEALELVIRSLGTQFSTVPGVAGAATTAAGEAIVALDLNLLVASVGVDDQSPLHVDSAPEESLLVMVVDDSRTQRMVATSQLETVGVETITAENGAVAIELLNAAERLPDIILMDVEMPVKDGIQALREIRKSVRYGHVPVIMITSRTGLKHRAMAQAAGCNGYMGKPFNFRMLIGQINELTGQRLQLS